jgi:hypothetical protein
MISKRNFVSEDPREQQMLTRAQKFLETMPPGGLIETDFKDKSNPAKFYGDIQGQRAVAIFDQLWEPDDCLGIDWKSGVQHTSYVDQYEIQGYFLSELYKQKYSTSMKKLFFKFLADDKTYEVKLLEDEKSYKKADRAVKNVLNNIEKEKFDKKCSGLCNFCDNAMFCPMDL